MKIENIEIDHKVLATHFLDRFSNLASATETMRLSKRKYEKDGVGLWEVYVKAYNYDVLQDKKNEVSSSS